MGGNMSDSATAPEAEDVGNIVGLEHVNLTVPDQSTATAFYLSALGGTRDPYLMVGVENMWVNLGDQQFHLPTSEAQRLRGHVGLVTPSLDTLRERLSGVEERLSGTEFGWWDKGCCIEVTGPWGNSFRCYDAGSRKFGEMSLGIPYVEFDVPAGSSAGIATFYRQVMGAPTEMSDGMARVSVGAGQELRFNESHGEIPEYDGHHIAIYVAGFSGPYGALAERGLITEEIRNHQFRFQQIVDPESGEGLFEIEHEVRSMKHPMYGRDLVNRNPGQDLGAYVRGGDAVYL